jgi:hypothetical protein
MVLLFGQRNVSADRICCPPKRPPRAPNLMTHIKGEGGLETEALFV